MRAGSSVVASCLSGRRLGPGYRPRPSTSLVLLLALLAFLATSFRPAGAVVPGNKFVVSDNGGDKTSPSVSGDLVVWEDKRGGNSDIYGKRLSAAGGAEFPITSGVGNERRPAVSGGFVVWEDDRDGATTGWDIYGKDLSLGPDAPEIPVVTAPGDQRKPKVSGKKVVWEDWRKSTPSGFDLDVYYKDLAADPPESAGHEIPAPAGNQSNPAISGGTVVYEDDSTGEKNVYGKDLHSAEGAFPIGTGAAWQDQPAISGSLVVWREDNGNNYDIFGKDLMAKDLETGRVFQVTTNTADQWSPAISGTVVIWADGRNGNSDTYGKDLATGREFYVTRDAAPQDAPAVDGETVVWENQRIGETDYGTWDIRGSSLDVAPAAPASLEANPGEGGVNLSWSAVPEADLAGYNVYRADSQGGPFTKLNAERLPATATSYADPSAPGPGATFYYRVKAQDAAGSESAAVAASITTPVPPPATPPAPPPIAQPPAQPPAPVPAPPAPPQVVINNPKPVVPVRKIVRITVKSPAANARVTLTVTRNGKVVVRRAVAANSRFSFKPSSAGRYTVKASVSNASHSKSFRAR